VEVAIADIRVGERHRKNMHDLNRLAASICEQGLLQAVGITGLFEQKDAA
jgi:hypothetical protein